MLGYASLDSISSATSFNGVDATTVVRSGPGPALPLPGGIAHIALPLSTTTAVSAVSWVGSDPWGRAWVGALASAGIDVSGVETAGSRSPHATLINVESGGTICLFEPGDLETGALTERQAAVVVGAEWVIVNVGPTAATWDALHALPVTSRLAFAVKRDEAALLPALTAALLARADVVSCSTTEHAWLAECHGALSAIMRPTALLIETRGRDGVVWSRGSGAPHEVSAARELAVDATGAGDTFVGALIALLATHPPGTDDATDAAVRAAVATVGDMLQRREDRSMEKETT